MKSIESQPEKINSFFEGLKKQVVELVSQEIAARCEKEVEQFLYRGPHKRRHRVGQRQTQAYCKRCGTRQAGQFSRNGHRARQQVTSYGVLTIWQPRVVCACGGSVALPFSLLKPYQRFFEDLVAQIGRWATLGLSLRQMQAEIGEQHRTQVGIRKLNELVQRVRKPAELTFSSVPPVILLDAIWLTLLEPTNRQHQDKLGRQRRTKQRHKVCVLVALGLYPQTGRWGILGWHLANAESQSAWERLLTALEGRGLYRERGVELFIHDGGAGLVAALQLIYPHIPHQRCLFHKLRNLWQAIRPPANLSRDDATTFKRNLFKQVHAVFFASSANLAAQHRDALVVRYQAEQPAFIATLCRDWNESVAFFRLLPRFPNWQLRYLRTTSLLERVNRMLRTLFRAASAFHSTAGLSAAVARVLNPVRLI